MVGCSENLTIRLILTQFRVDVVRLKQQITGLILYNIWLLSHNSIGVALCHAKLIGTIIDPNQYSVIKKCYG